MYHGIKVVKAKEILTNLPVKIKGSNKSKTRLSMLDRIRKFYYERKAEYLMKKISDLSVKKDIKGEEIWNKIESNSEVEGMSEDNEKLNDLYNKYQDKIDSKLDKLTNEIKVATGKIDEINNSVEEEPTVEETTTENYQPLPEINVEQPVEEEQQEIAEQPVEEEKQEITEQPVEEENKFEREIRLAVENFNSQLAINTTNMIAAIENVYKSYTKERVKMAFKQSDEFYGNIIASKDKAIKARDTKISSLKRENMNLKSECELSKNELKKNYDINQKQQEDINSRDITINELKEQISSLQKTLDSKDNELNSKDQEIKRLKEFEEYYLTQRRAQVMAESLNNMVENEPVENTKTL